MDSKVTNVSAANVLRAAGTIVTLVADTAPALIAGPTIPPSIDAVSAPMSRNTPREPTNAQRLKLTWLAVLTCAQLRREC
jgi:hypothetical protein